MSGVPAVSRPRNRAFGLPLLTKELIEQAVSRRTYVLRTIYAVLLFFFAIMLFASEFRQSSGNLYNLLGKGRELFLSLVLLQTVGILLFAPALTCGAITTEKERNTFGLLLLTKLGPWTILLEKYLGRIITIGGYLLLSVPLLGFCYCFGGLEAGEIWAGILSLVVTICQVAAIGICCSAYCRTTVGAFLTTYVVTFLLLLGPILGHEILRLDILSLPGEAFEGSGTVIGWAVIDLLTALTAVIGLDPGWVTDWMPRTSIQLDAEQQSALFFAPGIVMFSWNAFTSPPAWQRIVLCLPALLSALFFLLLARLFLVRRAFVPATNRLMKLFRGLDRFFHLINDNPVTKGIVVINDTRSLPDDQPIAWRETSKKALGTVRYLVRILVVLQFPTLFICLLAVTYHSGTYQWYNGVHPAITSVTAIAWAVAVLFISVKSATLVSGERSSETLDVLLSTPIHSREFIEEKFQGVVRLMLVVAMPLMTTVIMQTWFGIATRGLFGNEQSNLDDGNFLLSYVLTVFEIFFVSVAVVIAYRLSEIRNFDWMSGLGLVLIGAMAATAILMPSLGNSRSRTLSPMTYFLIATAGVVIYLPLVAWVCFSIGLRMKTQTRAIFASLALIIAWCVLPIAFLIIIWEIFNFRQDPGHRMIGYILLFSPASIPFFLEAGGLREIVGDSIWFRTIFNFTLYFGITFWVRHQALRKAPGILGRLHDDRPHHWRRIVDGDTVRLVPSHKLDTFEPELESTSANDVIVDPDIEMIDP